MTDGLNSLQVAQTRSRKCSAPVPGGPALWVLLPSPAVPLCFLTCQAGLTSH